MRAVSYLFLLSMLDILTMNKVYQPVKSQKELRECAFNATIVENEVVLRRVTSLAKYIFTGKIHGVDTVYNEVLKKKRKLYKVYIRRVVKGDLDDIMERVRFGSPRALSFTGANVLVESVSRHNCPPLRLRTYAIFLSDMRRKGNKSSLHLLVDPVPLNLQRLERIEAAVKGNKYYFVIDFEIYILKI